MRVDQLGVESLLRDESGGSTRRAFPFAADPEYVDVVAHDMGEVHQHLFVGKGGEADAASTLYYSRGLI